MNHENESYPCSLNVMGYHNALNATASLALSKELAWDVPKALKSLPEFKGVRRRLQKVGERDGKILFEDFAHHPTAVKMTLQSLKAMYPKKRVVALFEPRSWTSRLNVFQEEYVQSLKEADVIWTVKPYDTSRIEESLRFSSEKLSQDLKKEGKIVFYEQDFKTLVKNLLSFLKSGDVVVVMSNGSFGGVLNEIKSFF